MDQLYKYNKWIYETECSDILTIVYYLAPDESTEANSITNRFEDENEQRMYCPYNEVKIDINPDATTLASIDIEYIKAANIDVSLMIHLNDVSILNCENLSNIDGLNDSMITFLDLSNTNLGSFIELHLPDMIYVNNIYIENCGLTEIPSLENIDTLYTIDVSYNNISGSINLSNFKDDLISLDVRGNKLINIEGDPSLNLENIYLSGNLLQNLNMNCDHVIRLDASMNPLVSVNLHGVEDGCEINLTSCELKSITINGKYMDNCKIIKEYFEQELSDTRISLYNNHLDIKDQGLNTEKILVSPQFIGNRLFYDPDASNSFGDITAIDSSIARINNNTKDPDFLVICKSLSYNILFDGIKSYHDDLDDAYIRQKVLNYPLNNGILNIYDAQNLLNNPNSALSRALKIIGDNFKVKEIRTNNPSISKYFPNTTRIVLIPSPLQNPSVFSIKLVTDDSDIF